jgi:hypothetical protein
LTWLVRHDEALHIHLGMLLLPRGEPLGQDLPSRFLRLLVAAGVQRHQWHVPDRRLVEGVRDRRLVGRAPVDADHDQGIPEVRSIAAANHHHRAVCVGHDVRGGKAGEQFDDGSAGFAEHDHAGIVGQIQQRGPDLVRRRLDRDVPVWRDVGRRARGVSKQASRRGLFRLQPLQRRINPGADGDIVMAVRVNDAQRGVPENSLGRGPSRGRQRRFRTVHRHDDRRIARCRFAHVPLLRTGSAHHTGPSLQ